MQKQYELTRSNIFFTKYPNWSKLLGVSDTETIVLDQETINIKRQWFDNNLCPKCGNSIVCNIEIWDKTAGYHCSNYFNKKCDYVGLQISCRLDWLY